MSCIRGSVPVLHAWTINRGRFDISFVSQKKAGINVHQLTEWIVKYYLTVRIISSDLREQYILES